MKSKKILFSSLVTLLSFSTLVGCGDNGNSSSNSKNQITSSIDPELIAQRAELETMLNKMKDGVKIEGVVKETISLLDGYHGSKTGDTIKIDYNAEYIYEAGQERGYSAIVTYQEEGYPEEEFINIQSYEGKDGYTYFDALDYDNTIDRYPYYSGDQLVNFGYYCLNPFDYLLPEDFTKTGTDTFELNKGKTSFLASNIFGDISSAFEHAIKKCEFKVENGQFKSFTLEPIQYHDSMTDNVNHSAVYYYADFTATLEFKDIGTAKVVGMQPKEATEYTPALQNAFDMFENKNYTVHLYGHDQLINSDGIVTEEHILHEYTYYDGEDMFAHFLQFDVEEEVFDSSTSSYEYSVQGENGIMSGFGVTYDEMVPKMSEIEAEILEYNEDTGLYSICKELVADIANIAIVPRITRFAFDFAGYTTSCDIKLDASGAIEYINIKYASPVSSYTTCYGDVMLTFYDINNTKIPYGMKTY